MLHTMKDMLIVIYEQLQYDQEVFCILHNVLLYENGQDFVETQYLHIHDELEQSEEEG